MTSPRIRWFIRIALLSMIGLAGLYCLLTSSIWVRAEANAQPMQQQGTPGYDGPVTDTPGAGNDNGYPIDSTSTSTLPSSASKTPTIMTNTPAGTPTDTLTPTATATLAPNAFKTEDSEINGAKRTPPVTDTPGSSPTPVPSATMSQTQTIPTKTLIKKANSGNQVDWNMFWIGFSVPVLAGCGVVLFYLDRRPDLFKRKK